MDHSQQLGETKISKLLYQFALPAIVSMMVSSLYAVVNRIFIGNSEGSLGIAAIAIGFPIMMVYMAFIMLIGIGAIALVSIRLGERKNDEAEHIIGNTVTLLIIASVVITALSLTFLDPLLRIFGASNEVMPYAQDYMRIIIYGVIFQCISVGMNNFIRGEGKPRIAMLTMLSGAVLNIILCPIFIFGLDMGIKGSALATIISQAVTAILVMSYFFSGKSMLKIRKHYLLLNIKITRKILSLGSAQFVMQLAGCFVMALLNHMLFTYGGDMAISAMGIVTGLQFLAFMPLFGISQGVQPIIGYNFGAHKYDRVKKALKLAMISSTVIAVFGFTMFEVFPRQIASIFNSTDTQLIDFTVYTLRVFMLSIPLVGFQIVGSTYFTSVGKPVPATILSLSRQFIFFVPAVMILPLFFDLHGVILAGPVADTGAFILTVIWLTRELRHLDRSIKENHLSLQQQAQTSSAS